MWRNFRCGDYSNVDKFLIRKNIIHTALLWDLFCCHQCYFVANLFFWNLRCFVAKPLLSRFTHFPCGGKLSPKFCPWRKITKIMYVPARKSDIDLTDAGNLIKIQLTQIARRLSYFGLKNTWEAWPIHDICIFIFSLRRHDMNFSPLRLFAAGFRALTSSWG